jgi:hypothetical protein
MQTDQSTIQSDTTTQSQTTKKPIIFAPSDPGEENICIGCE